jgi:F0F1-type ATP synthase membrane subunit c/vacuolar-type H+-ATPase subunit K
VWVLERASDGARMTLNFSGQALTGAALSVGAAVVVTAMSTGWVLSAAGQAIAFVPNEIGRSLLHNERITR